MDCRWRVDLAVNAETPPFGTFAPTPMQQTIIGLCQSGPLAGILRRGTFRRPLSRLVSRLRPGPVDVERGPLRYRLDVADNAVEVGLLLDPHYQRASIRFVTERLPHGGTLVDCGANVGQFALAGLIATGAGGRVVAVEASENPLNRLRVNAALSGLADRLTIVPCAVGDSDGALRFSVNARDTALSKADAAGNVVVPMKSLLSICRDSDLTRIDVLKIDVEGMEDRVLAAFFASAPESLWPSAICLEDELAHLWAEDIRPVLAGCGYRALPERSKGNVFLVREA